MLLLTERTKKKQKNYVAKMFLFIVWIFSGEKFIVFDKKKGRL